MPIWPCVHRCVKVSMVTKYCIVDASNFCVSLSNTGFCKASYYITVSEIESFALKLEVLGKPYWYKGCFLCDL